MADIEDVATQKAGGVPVWVWALGAVAVVVGYVYFRNRMTNTATIIPNDAAVSGTGNLAGPTPTQSTTGSNIPNTLSGWMNNAIATAQQNGVDPLAATTALSNFVSGNPLTPSESTIVSGAIGNEGLPPGYDPSSVDTANPPVDTTTAPPIAQNTFVPPPSSQAQVNSASNPFTIEANKLLTYAETNLTESNQRLAQAATVSARADKATGATRIKLLNEAAQLRTSASTLAGKAATDRTSAAQNQAQASSWMG